MGNKPIRVVVADDEAEQVAAYAAAGCDELIVPDFTMGSMARRKDTCDQFLAEVASNFR